MSHAKLVAPAIESATWAAMTVMVEPCVVVRFTVPGEPVSKERPRFDKDGDHVYTPQKTEDAETAVAWRFRAAAKGWRVDAVSEFGVMALFCAGTRRKRDVDNMLKLILDALNRLAWKDDAQVSEVAARLVRGCPVARTDVLIYRIPPEVARAQ